MDIQPQFEVECNVYRFIPYISVYLVKQIIKNITKNETNTAISNNEQCEPSGTPALSGVIPLPCSFLLHWIVVRRLQSAMTKVTRRYLVSFDFAPEWGQSLGDSIGSNFDKPSFVVILHVLQKSPSPPPIWVKPVNFCQHVGSNEGKVKIYLL